MAARAGAETPGHGTLIERLASELGAAQRSASDHVKAKACIIDSLAGAFASIDLPWSQQALSSLAPAPGGPCGILGRPEHATAPEAVFVNAVLSHGLVRDDMHLGSVSHLGAVIIPTTLALAQTARVSGATLLAAIVGGYEAGGRLGRAVLDVEVARVHRPTGVTGPFAAAAAASLVLGLEARAMATALALAANTAAGYNEWAATGGSEMYFHAGFAARNAFTAVALARAGAFASPTALEGSAGLLAAFGKDGATSLPQNSTGEAEIHSVFFKQVPACNYAQSAAQAAQVLAADRRFAVGEVQRIVVHVPYAAAHYPGCDVPGPFEHVLQAKMSIQYNVAAALLTASFDEANYMPTAQPAITSLARLIEVVVDEDLTRAYPARQGARVSVTSKTGQRLEQAVDDVAPASAVLIRDRFLAAADERLGRARAEALVQMIDSLEDVDDAGRLVTLTQPAPAERT